MQRAAACTDVTVPRPPSQHPLGGRRGSHQTGSAAAASPAAARAARLPAMSSRPPSASGCVTLGGHARHASRDPTPAPLSLLTPRGGHVKTVRSATKRRACRRSSRPPSGRCRAAARRRPTRSACRSSGAPPNTRCATDHEGGANGVFKYTSHHTHVRCRGARILRDDDDEGRERRRVSYGGMNHAHARIASF